MSGSLEEVEEDSAWVKKFFIILSFILIMKYSQSNFFSTLQKRISKVFNMKCANMYLIYKDQHQNKAFSDIVQF